jgi:PAS domain S-box-containing protein
MATPGARRVGLTGLLPSRINSHGRRLAADGMATLFMAEGEQTPDDPAGAGTPDQDLWPPEDVKRIVDSLADGVLVIGTAASILYLNPAASAMLRRPSKDLIGHSLNRILPPDESHWAELLAAAVEGTSTEVVGSRQELSLLDGQGRRVPVELVVSVGMTRMGWPVAIAVIRSGERRQLRRLTAFTEQLLEVLSASSSSSPAEQLLASLCRRLGWDVGALWGLQPDGTLICRGVWTRPEAPTRAYVEEKRRNPMHDVGGLARLVMERGSPVWFTDLASESRFTSDAVLEDGLTTACALPIRYGGQCLGAIKMMRRARREPDPDLIELVSAISGPVGAILHALEQSVERDELVVQLEATRQRLELLLRANKAITEATGYAQALDGLARVAVPVLADLCLIDVVQEDGSIRRLAARHSDPTKAGLVSELLVHYAPEPDGGHPSATVMATRRSSWLPNMSDDFLRSTSKDERHLAIIRELGFTSYMTVPLVTGERVVGTVTLVSAGSGRRFTQADLTGAEELATQVAGVVERARQFDWQRQISHTLQQSLLPDRLPEIAGLTLAGKYLPAAMDAEVGGDWYDAVDVNGRRAALIVGDVEGHDMVAASVMGRLRHGLALLLTEGASPAEAIERLNGFVVASAMSHFATVLVAEVDVQSGAITAASAGHPSPIIVGTSGSGVMSIRPGPPIGVGEASYTESTGYLGDSDSLVLYTDGLVERRGSDLDKRVMEAVRVTEEAPPGDSVALIYRLVAQLLGAEQRMDDVALLVASRQQKGN